MVRNALSNSFVMRVRVLALLAGISALLAVAPRAPAGPLPEHWVAKGSDWVVHVDAERLREADALKPIFDALVSSAWGSSLSDMGIDARMDLTDITMFGTITRGPEAKGQTTTMLQGGAALREAIQQHVAAHEGYPLLLRPARRTDGRGISAWTIEKLSVHVALVPIDQEAGGAATELVAVLSDHSEQLQACIGLLLEHEASVRPAGPTTDPAASEQDGPPGCVIVVRANDLNAAHPPLRSALLSSAEEMHGYLGYREEPGQTVVFARLRVEGGEAASGDQMVSSLNRMVEFWRHSTRSMAEQAPALGALVDLIASSEVSREGHVVQLAMEEVIAHDADPAAKPEGGGDRLVGVGEGDEDARGDR